ncbi:MAG: mevalonate kinase [Dermabacter sp.]|nr:mevalonate kinase [Dermabacter sp.]
MSVNTGAYGVGRAHAKAILIGEHAVVYGHPAIAFPVPALRISATATLLPFPDAGRGGHEGVALDGSLTIDGVPTLDGTLRMDGALTLDVPSSDTGDRRGKRRVATVGDPSTGAIYVDLHGDHGEDELAHSALRTILTHVGQEPGRAEVHVEGSIPTARGLGSSAAMASAIAVAVARLYGHELTSEERFELVQFVERIAHGTPSGLDAYATMADGPLWFQEGRAEPLAVETRPALLIADTGMPGRTLDAVADVRRLRGQQPETVNPALETIASLAHEAREGLGTGDLVSVGCAMNACHDVLRSLGVSHPALDTLVEAAREAGALGAKLTGGGQGGCIIALAPSGAELPGIARALRAAGATHVWDVHEEDQE